MQNLNDVIDAIIIDNVMNVVNEELIFTNTWQEFNYWWFIKHEINRS